MRLLIHKIIRVFPNLDIDFIGLHSYDVKLNDFCFVDSDCECMYLVKFRVATGDQDEESKGYVGS